jgi:hypothetical protein
VRRPQLTAERSLGTLGLTETTVFLEEAVLLEPAGPTFEADAVLVEASA